MIDLKKLLDEATESGPERLFMYQMCTPVVGMHYFDGRFSLERSEVAAQVEYVNADIHEATAKRVLELEAALRDCTQKLMDVYHSEFDGVWAQEDFDRIEAKYLATLKGGAS